MSTQNRLRIALQRSGRLADSSLELLARCGLKTMRGKDQLVCVGENLPVDLMLVRDDDVPFLIREGVCDAGIVGFNLAREIELELLGRGEDCGFEIEQTLDFGACRLSIAGPEEAPFRGLGDLSGQRIATSYPATLAWFLREQGISAQIVTLSGSVEIAPRLGTADLVCDLVSTGNTLAANGLIERMEVSQSQAVLLRAKETFIEDRAEVFERMLERMRGVLQVRESKYIMLHAPRAALTDIRRLLPGSEIPTVMPLEGSADRVAIHAVCNENVFWETLEALKAAGASALLVLPVEKMLA
ncbi:MAG: ATP phosphoribosyltransferase [Gammaproteobacteria bacterium]|nr:ATP phosphoribosyltransferase [Gammaproteobacteria bacterium]